MNKQQIKGIMDGIACAITKRRTFVAPGDTNVRRMLDAAADYVEDAARNLGLGVVVYGGVAGQSGVPRWRGLPALKLSVGLAPDVRGKVDACRRFSERLESAFNCAQAGIDANEDVIWIIGMAERHEHVQKYLR